MKSRIVHVYVHVHVHERVGEPWVLGGEGWTPWSLWTRERRAGILAGFFVCRQGCRRS